MVREERRCQAEGCKEKRHWRLSIALEQANFFRLIEVCGTHARIMLPQTVAREKVRR